MAGNLKQLVADLEENAALQAVKQRLAEGEDAAQILAELREGMNLVGSRFETHEYFLSDLVMAGEIFKEAMELVEPHLKHGAAAGGVGKVIIGTAKGDIHDIGKNIVVTMLKGAGFEVFDLGVNVPPERFVEAVQETGAEIVGISALLTIAFDPMKETIAALEKAGLRDKVKVAVGGAPVTEEVRKYVGADLLGKDAQQAVEICRGVVRGA
ncbi:MAG: corrinoid protein [Chloroflexi bacterium]|nr:corrinoid protein [Chloroflexota bacterium]